MKLSQLSLAVLAQVMIGSCMPADPLNIDLCKSLGIDLDLTPELTHAEPFRIIIQKKDFMGPERQLGTGGQVFTGPLSDDDDEEDKVTLKDGVAMNYEGERLSLRYFNVDGSPYTGLAWKRKPSVDNQLTFEIMSTCDPVKRKAVKLLRPTNPRRKLYSCPLGYIYAFMLIH